MVKKLYLFLTLATLAISPLAQCSPENAVQQAIIANQDCMYQITQTKHAITLELHKILAISQKAIEHYKDLLKKDYEPLAKKVGAALSGVISSEEFSSFIEQITDDQVDQIVDKGISFNDIRYPERGYPIDKKITDELKAFPADQLFNLFYVLVVRHRSSILLLQKLDVRFNELQEALISQKEPSIQPINE